MPPLSDFALRLFILLAFIAWAIEVCRRLPFTEHLRRLHSCSLRSARVMRSSGVSDHWKQSATLLLSRRIMCASLTLGGMILLALLPLILWGVSGDPLQLLRWLVSLPGLIISILCAGLYAWGRKRFAR